LAWVPLNSTPVPTAKAATRNSQLACSLAGKIQRSIIII
jgi:hypothetical protein